VAWRHGGVLQFHQLLEVGVTRHHLRQLLAAGRLVRLEHGIYSLPGLDDPWLCELRAAVARAGPDAVVWRRSAGRWWGLDGVDRDPAIEVASGQGARHGDRRISRLRQPSSLRTTEERQLVVTTPAQTLLDLGTVFDADVVERATEAALRRRLARVGELRALVDAAPRARTGAAALREVLARRPAGAPPTESDAETLFLQLVRAGGHPEPRRQYAVVSGGLMVRLDFAWPPTWQAAEIDGARFHGEDVRGRDLRRQNAVIFGGWSLRRFTWQDVALYPDYVARVLRDWFS
jgi:hypothetical protein